VAAHWVADRQYRSGNPRIWQRGTATPLPAPPSPAVTFASPWECRSRTPDLTLRQLRVPGRVRTRGRMVVVGHEDLDKPAHESHFMVVLCRTGEPGSDRHDGLSQLIVDLSWPGVTVRPIPFLDGSHHFNEVRPCRRWRWGARRHGTWRDRGWLAAGDVGTDTMNARVPIGICPAWKLIETFIAEHPAAKRSKRPCRSGSWSAATGRSIRCRLRWRRAMDTGASTSVQGRHGQGSSGQYSSMEVVRVNAAGISGRDSLTPGPGFVI